MFFNIVSEMPYIAALCQMGIPLRRTVQGVSPHRSQMPSIRLRDLGSFFGCNTQNLHTRLLSDFD